MKAMGKVPSGPRLDRIRKSGNFKEGIFQNLSETKMLLEGVNYGKMLLEYYKKPGDTIPPQLMPSVKTDLNRSLLEAESRVRQTFLSLADPPTSELSQTV